MTTDAPPSPSLQEPAGGACCGAAAADASSAETNPAPASEPRGQWMWSLAGLAALAILIAGAAVLVRFGPSAAWNEAARNLLFIGKAVWSILPFFLISVAISAWVTVSGFSQRIRVVFEHKEKIAIAGAALVGATIPTCSCGVIPLIAALLASGVPLGPVMAFWISSPLMSPSMFLLTAGVLGTQYAIARLVAAVVLGMGAGYLIFLLSSRGLLRDQLHGLARVSCCGPDPASSQEGAQVSSTWKRFWPEAGSVTLFLGKWLLVAFVLEALIVHYLDPAWISSLLGGNRPYAIPLATAVGIPLYTSGVGTIPIVQGLIGSGMGPGAALAFFVAGPVTTIPAMVAVAALVKRQTFAVYLASGIVGSLVAGYGFQFIAG